jgi:hypothetical protein
MARRHRTEASMGDKSPKSIQRNKTQKAAAKAQTKQEKDRRQEAHSQAQTKDKK